MKSPWIHLLMLLVSSTAFSAELTPRKDWSFFEARLIPVQSGGRVKPLDSFARETILYQTGSRTYKGWEPVELLISWIAFPKEWQEVKFVQVGRLDVRRQLGLDESRTFFSPAELYQNSAFLQYADRMQRGEEGSKPPSMQGTAKADPRDQEFRRVLERVALFRDVIVGSAWLVIPKAAPTPWLSLAARDSEGDPIRAQFAEMLRGYQSGNQVQFQSGAKNARAAVESSIPGWNKSVARTIGIEALYNLVHPFRFAWILYLSGALIFILSRSKRVNTIALAVTGLAFASHIFGFALRCYVAGRPPVTNMYESIIWVCLGVVIFAGILYALQRQAITLIVAAVVATAGMIAADAAPAMMDPGIHPLVPVLRSNYWLTIHVLTITLGYAAFALTFGLGNVTLYHYLTRKEGFLAKASSLNQLTYRAMQFGVVLLAAGTILGGIWADYSWGRFWGWDPKETWALIALLCYLVILHGRFTNWVGQFAFALWTVVGFLSVLMAWYGVNFILGVGLHSYGFSSGGFGFVIGFTSLQLGWVALVAFRHRAAAKRT